MSAQRVVSSAAAGRYSLTLLLIVAAAAFYVGWRRGVARDAIVASPASAQRVALVRDIACGRQRCQSLWIGVSREAARKVATLAAGERCDEIAWAPDGFRVGFVINGYQLRIFDGASGDSISHVNLLEPDRTPTSRVARGVTFSQNGAAVTFDDCPRSSSGCKSALMAVR